jgi:hypothetical protein
MLNLLSDFFPLEDKESLRIGSKPRADPSLYKLGKGRTLFTVPIWEHDVWRWRDTKDEGGRPSGCWVLKSGLL